MRNNRKRERFVDYKENVKTSDEENDMNRNGKLVVERGTGIDEFSRESRRLKRVSTASLKKRCIVVRCKNELVYPFASTLRAQDRVI